MYTVKALTRIVGAKQEQSGNIDVFLSWYYFCMLL